MASRTVWRSCSRAFAIRNCPRGALRPRRRKTRTTSPASKRRRRTADLLLNLRAHRPHPPGETFYWRGHGPAPSRRRSASSRCRDLRPHRSRSQRPVWNQQHCSPQPRKQNVSVSHQHTRSRPPEHHQLRRYLRSPTIAGRLQWLTGAGSLAASVFLSASCSPPSTSGSHIHLPPASPSELLSPLPASQSAPSPPAMLKKIKFSPSPAPTPILAIPCTWDPSSSPPASSLPPEAGWLRPLP